MIKLLAITAAFFPVSSQTQYNDVISNNSNHQIVAKSIYDFKVEALGWRHH